MTITKKDLDTKYAHLFRNVSQPELVKAEILKNFSEEPEPHEWTEQDIHNVHFYSTSRTP